jgi:hypothetical protein
LLRTGAGRGDGGGWEQEKKWRVRGDGEERKPEGLSTGARRLRFVLLFDFSFLAWSSPRRKLLDTCLEMPEILRRYWLGVLDVFPPRSFLWWYKRCFRSNLVDGLGIVYVGADAKQHCHMGVLWFVVPATTVFLVNVSTQTQRAWPPQVWGNWSVSCVHGKHTKARNRFCLWQSIVVNQTECTVQSLGRTNVKCSVLVQLLSFINNSHDWLHQW